VGDPVRDDRREPGRRPQRWHHHPEHQSSAQRARIRATKAPTGLLSQPTRTVRVVQRTLCKPQQQIDQPLLDACLNNAPVVANGLVAGQYVAPIFEFIFPENVKPGDAIVPFDMWHLPFLRSGEGAATPTGVGALEPAPW
jgi:hypothetical protein